MATVAGSDISPDRLTLTAFGGIVLIAGANFVAVRFSNQEVPPFLGGGVRFALAALLFLLVVALRRLPILRGRELVGIVLYGLLGFTGFYALAYRGRSSSCRRASPRWWRRRSRSSPCSLLLCRGWSASPGGASSAGSSPWWV